MKLVRTLVFTLVLLVFSCKEEGNKPRYLPASIGPINSLVVVMDDALWKGEVGDKVREHFAAPELGLTWDEPRFSINHFPPRSFHGTTRKSRAILYVQKDTLNLGHLKTDMYAAPQKVGVVKGHTNEELMANIDKKAPAMISAFKKLEIGEAQKRFLKSLNKEGVLESTFGITMDIPSIFRVGSSTFVKDIVKMRDTIGATYIPGTTIPGKVTHMRTEPAFAPHVFPVEVAGRKAVEVRGLWDIKNYAMAGPFVTYIINDPANKRKMVVEGFTFAPATAKRDYMFELEAMLKTIKFDVKK